jgi:hypothetical protein
MNCWKKIAVVWGPLIILILGVPSIASAQGTPTGTISGYILDPDGRAVSGAGVVVESASTGATRGFSSIKQGL